MTANNQVPNPLAANLKAGAETAWRTFYDLLRTPAHTANFPAAGEAGYKFYLRIMFYCAVAPAMAINGLLTVLNWISPRFWDFNDVNPTTIFVVAPAWLLIGLAQAWVLGWCLYAGLRMFNVARREDIERIRLFGWVAGAVILTLSLWWYGFGVPFYTLGSSLDLPRWFGQNLLTLAFPVIFILSVRVVLGGLLATIAGARTHVLSGGVAGATLFFVGWNIINGFALGFLAFVAMKVLR